MKKLLVLLIALFTLAANSLPAQTVYITKTGKKYHDDGCRFLSRSKFSIELSDAIARGYGACSVCKPPTGTSSTPRTVTPNSTPNNNVAPSSNDNKSTSSVQCAGTTKAGAQCKRMTKSSNGYCWQHGGN